MSRTPIETWSNIGYLLMPDYITGYGVKSTLQCFVNPQRGYNAPHENRQRCRADPGAAGRSVPRLCEYAVVAREPGAEREPRRHRRSAGLAREHGENSAADNRGRRQTAPPPLKRGGEAIF